MVRLSRWLIAVLVIAAVVVPSFQTRPVWAQENDPKTLAQGILDKLLAGDYAGVVASLDSSIAGQLSADQLKQGWEALVQQVGPYQSTLNVQSKEAQGNTFVTFTLQFEKAPIDLLIGITPQGKTITLYFSPSQNAPQPEWTPPAYSDAAAFTEQDVTVGAGTPWALSGTLTLPTGTGPFPAVVLVHGSGPNDRDETIGPNKPFRDLAWGLASRGIAVLRYDKRTLVYGKEMVAQGSFTVNDETVDDALLAVKVLQGTAGIDPKRVFVIGHSQGGFLAPRIASRDPEIAGIVILAGNTRPLPDLVLEQTRYLLSLGGGTLSEQAQAQLAETEKVVNATKNAQPTDDPSTLLFNAPPAYWIDLNAYDPVATALPLVQPMLILQGERDYQVTMVDFQGWQTGLAGHQNVTFHSYPDLNHLFVSGEGPSTPQEYNMPGHVAEAVVNDIANWIKAH